MCKRLRGREGDHESINNKQIVGYIVGYIDWFIMSREQDGTGH